MIGSSWLINSMIGMNWLINSMIEMSWLINSMIGTQVKAENVMKTSYG